MIKNIIKLLLVIVVIITSINIINTKEINAKSKKLEYRENSVLALNFKGLTPGSKWF